MDMLDKARAAQNAAERLANQVPGFKGYRERELRRDADQLTREHLAGRLEGLKQPLAELSVEISRSGDLSGINRIETARKRLDATIARIRYANRGYHGFFDAIKVDEAALGRVYDLDLALLDGVGAILGTQASRVPDVETLIENLDALGTRLGEREAILGGFK